MSLYSLALFVHVVGAMALLATLVLEWMALWSLRRGGTEALRAWYPVVASLPRVYPVVGALLLLPALYMAILGWRHAAWVYVALAAVLILGVLGAAVSGPRLKAARRAVDASDTLESLRAPGLWISIHTRTFIALGVVFLMTNKPEAGSSLLAIVIAATAGFAAAVLQLRMGARLHSRQREQLEQQVR